MSNSSVIPAQSGYFTVYDLGECYDLCEAVIGWRVVTESLGDRGEVSSTTYPITVVGDPTQDCVGIQQPNGKIILFVDGEIYPSLYDLNESRRR